MTPKNVLEERINELAMLNEIGRALSSTININDLMELIYQQTTRVMDVSAFYIALYMEESNQMMFIFDVLNGERQPQEEQARDFGNGRTEYIIKNQKSLLIESNPQKVYKKLGIVSSDTKAKACAGVPMIYGGKSIGALVVQSYKLNEAYDQHHIDLLSTIASQAAIAIENARLFERLEERNIDLLQAKRETDNILNNVKDGLFLLNREFKIASQYSASLEKIFEQKNLGEQSLTNFLEDKIEDKDYQNLCDFKKLLFDSQVDEHSLYELNPISQTKIMCQGPGNKAKIKYLTFDFRRINQNGTIEEIIVSANDVTEQVNLANRLHTIKEKNKKLMEWLFLILNVDGQMLDEFMKSAEIELNLLHSIQNNSISYQDLNKIYRAVHTIKGNASMLELNFIADEAHLIEEELKLAKDDETKIETCLEKIHSGLNRLTDIFNNVKTLIDRISRFHTNFRPTRTYESNMVFKSLQKLIDTGCEKYGKKAILDYSQFDAAIVPHQHRMRIRNILVQLTRNSIYHGIETREERNAKGKDETGRISISNSSDDEHFNFVFEDDGRGIQLDKLRVKAQNLPDWNGGNRSEKKILELIFLPGVTTSEKTDLTAGRGMGLDAVKEKVESGGGKISVDYKKDIFCRFTISFPT
jgi:Amt family ammonium transporter